jgi:hypothetical protein
MYAPLEGGAHCPAAPEPPASLSVGLAWTVTRLMERPALFHDGMRAKWHAAALQVSKKVTEPAPWP